MPLRSRGSSRKYYKTTKSGGLSSKTPVSSSSGFSQGSAYSVTGSGMIVKKKPVTLTKFIKNVAKGLSETKRTMFYSSAQNFNVQTGKYADANIDIHNQLITSNLTDIRRIIPFVVQGTSDNERIGESVRPVSLNLRGRIGVNVFPTVNDLTFVAGNTEIVAVMYILQHKQLKSYSALSSLNDFTQLLETGENTTVAFGGQQWHAQMPVSNQYYQLVKKKKYILRWAGLQNGMPPAGPFGSSTGANGVANSHNYTAEFSMNLKKHLPAKLLYPENNATTGQDDPTNSSLFLCVGFYSNGVLISSSQPILGLALQYTTELLYKDA